MKECIKTPEDIDWAYFWAQELEKKTDRKKDWDKAAKTFHKKNRKDDYKNELFNNLIISKDDTILDIGCGEGSITIPVSKKVKSITGLDSSKEMLKLLNKRAKKRNITNINTIQMSIEELKYEELGNYDVVIASRSLNGIIPIKETLTEINKIANKYVFITLFGPNNWIIEKEFQEYLGNETNEFPSYLYLIHILEDLGIYANMKRLEINDYRKYSSIEDAMDNGKFRLDLLNDGEIKKLKTYLKDILTEDPETGQLYNKRDKSDWILIWWKKE